MVIDFNINKFNFYDVIANSIFDGKNLPSYNANIHSLKNLHKHISAKNINDVIEKIYSIFRKEEFVDLYDQLCVEIIDKYYKGDAKYQAIPSARVHMPDQQQTVDFHCDQFYGHGPNVKNYWLPLTNVYDSNSIYVINRKRSQKLIEQTKKQKESILSFNEKCLGESEPLKMSLGKIFVFDALTIHGTKLNRTSSTRVSFDFRIVIGDDDIGLKDPSFFISSRKLPTNSVKKTAALYYGRNGLEDILPSQKYQQLILLEYCSQNNLSPFVLETELSGFDYYPMLFNLLEGTRIGTFTDLVVFSNYNLPNSRQLKNKVMQLCEKYGITLHLVLEDEKFEPASELSK